MVDWPHAPVHRLSEAGAYIVTAGTYRKALHFDAPERRTFLRDTLFSVADEFGWQLQAWAVMSNHYHFVALSPEDAGTLTKLIRKLHANTARFVNKCEETPGRKVWHEYYDTHLTYQRSYLARLRYVHENPVKHGLAREARLYEWCSAAWFEREADNAFRKTVESFKTDRIDVADDY